MKHKASDFRVVIDRFNFRDLCKQHGVTTNNVLFNRITWRLGMLAELEDAGQGHSEHADELNAQLSVLFARMTNKIFGEDDA